jgi:hypothetical protein
MSPLDITQAILVDQPRHDPSQSSQRLALFDEAGHPVAFPSGGSFTPKWASYAIAAPGAATDGQTHVTWTQDTGGHQDPLLDLTTPDMPQVKAAGIYAVSVFAFPHSPTVQPWILRVDLDYDDNDSYSHSTCPPDSFSTSTSLTWYVPYPDGIILAGVVHHAGIPIDFTGNAYVVLLAEVSE